MSVTVKDVILFNFLLYWSNCVYKNMENECCVSIKQRNKTKYQNVELFLHLKLKWHKWKKIAYSEALALLCICFMPPA